MIPMRIAGEDVLVVMAKYPRAGRVKTRLARALGDEQACELYRAFLLDIAARFAAGPARLIWAIAPPEGDLRDVLGGDAACMRQEGDGLAQRMLLCFRRLLGAGARRVVMIGGDTPHLPESTVTAAFASLEKNHVALVPVRDGGYCLVGLRSPRDIFSGIEMSTPHVFARTVERARSLGLDVAVLERSFDIDDPRDLDSLRDLIASDRVHLPHTAAVLASIPPARSPFSVCAHKQRKLK